MQIRTIKADPSGNITLFLLDPVAPEIRKALNQELLARVYAAPTLAISCEAM